MKYELRTIIKKRSFKKSLITVLAVVLIGTIGFTNNWFGIFNKNTTYAAGDLNINWNVPTGDPIFVVENMLPGDTEDRDVDVTNGGIVSRDVGVIGVKTEEIASFAGVLDFVISADGSPIYGSGSPTGAKKLQDFFNEAASPSGLFLTTLSNGNSVTYNFMATFPSESGNEYQGARVVFDLIIGIVSDIPAECQDIKFSGPPIFGTSDNDVIQGTLKNDLIFALEGDDRVFGKLGDDCIVGGTGNDELRGEVGKDIVFGNEGNDKVYGGNNNDLLFGGAGNDLVKGENGVDILFGQEGDDEILGGNENDVMHGNSGNDKMNGENGSDQVFGDEDNDALIGGNGPDTIIGNTGTDSANGQNGTDTCDAETETNCEI